MRPPNLVDLAQAVLVPGCALAAVAHHLGRGLREAFLEWVRGRADVAKIKATGEARRAEIEAETVGRVAVLEAENRARLTELIVEHELRAALDVHSITTPRIDQRFDPDTSTTNPQLRGTPG